MPTNSVQSQQEEVRVLTLQTNQNNDHKLFRIQKGWAVQFRKGASLFGKNIELYINYPDVSSGKSFQRYSFRQLPWCSDSGNIGDDTALYTQVLFNVPGTFRYYFTLHGSSTSEGSGYFVVDPTLRVGSDNTILPIDCIQCQTVLSKNLGSFPEWKDRLRVAKETGYNMIHFTPIQRLGGSNSAYSLRDQFDLNVTFHPKGGKCTIADVEQLVNEMKEQWKILSLEDIVLNHTANETPWLQEHPEATFNTFNSPHLRPAYLVDRAIYHCSKDVATGKLAQQGIPANLNNEHQIGALWHYLYNSVLLPLRIHEFYSVNVENTINEFRKMIKSLPVPKALAASDLPALQIIQDPEYRRLKSTVDLQLAVQLYNQPQCGTSEGERVEQSCMILRSILEQLNASKCDEIQEHLKAASNCTIGTVRYERVQDDGLRIKEVSLKNPLAPLYFTHFGPDTDIDAEERLMFSENGQFLMAHNGWVMNADVLKNFAEEDSFVYLRRELIAWGDSVKFRYGKKREDSPFLWDHMARYCEETARVFHGIRLDNCHSTPIHVAEYMLDAARKVRPDLYVIAELFTNSDDTDNVFVNRLGINSLIREALNAPDSHELGRLVYRYGGEPVGAFILPPVRPLVPSIAHAIMMDLTHDNPSPVEKRTAFDMLPSAALVSMACCATGSNRGYDELVPHHIHVVSETRLYSSFSSNKESPGTVSSDTGIFRARNTLNNLHLLMGVEGYNQVFVDQVTPHVVTVTRHNPVTHESIVLVSYTSFCPPGHIPADYIKPLNIQGSLESVLFEMEQKPKAEGGEHQKCPGEFTRDPNFINGLSSIDVVVRENVPIEEAKLVRKDEHMSESTLTLHYTAAFKPGCVVAFKFRLLPRAQKAVDSVRNTMRQFLYQPRLFEITVLEPTLKAALDKLDLVALTRCLYYCNEEGNDEGKAGGVYDVPNFGKFVYCGLQGLESVMKQVRVNNDLGHPVCGNLRDGNWMIDYNANRLLAVESTKPVGEWLQSVLAEIKEIPRYLIPAYFDAIANKLYLAFINRSWDLMAPFIKNGSVFTKHLGLCCVQFVNVVRSAPLPELSPNLEPPQPVRDSESGLQRAPSIAAGLPHFCQGYMRNWGRDTFIALPGNLLITGRYDEARWIILAFAGTLRHGLIPNLLDGGKNARFNCRDATWFWLMAIQKYVEMVPNGYKILEDKVSRLYPRDDCEAKAPGEVDQTLEFVIQESLTRHFQGQQFRERNAGHKIDEQMTDTGFNNSIGVNLDTGFPFGGNEWNCGTWMDKMGSSSRAGNKGRPATPRDGSAVEIVGLCKAAVSFLAKMFKEKKYSYEGVSRIDESGNEINWSYTFWSQLIKDNFQKEFYVSKNPSDPERAPQYVNKRGIFKDSFRATHDWPDYQLRCNFTVALTVAPELVDAKLALEALEYAETVLVRDNSLGMKTLDPDDFKYRPNYDNSNDSAEYDVAQGFNYHQGPEWVWPIAYLLRAKLAMAQRLDDKQVLAKTVASVKSRLAKHFSHLLKNEWRSLPELTNEGGSYCKDSSPAQSWSTGCILEVLWDMKTVQQ